MTRLPDIKVDDNLRAIVGGNEPTIPTTEMNKRIWKYINAHNLKVPKPKVDQVEQK